MVLMRRALADKERGLGILPIQMEEEAWNSFLLLATGMAARRSMPWKWLF